MQRVKGQMHCMLSTLQSASLKKKMHRVSAQMCLCATVQVGLLKDTPAAVIFCCKGTDQHVRVRSNDVLGLERQLQIFHFLCLNMASLTLFQDGVSGVHKISRYNDEGLKRRENSLISFPLEIKYMYEVYT